MKWSKTSIAVEDRKREMQRKAKKNLEGTAELVQRHHVHAEVKQPSMNVP